MSKIIYSKRNNTPILQLPSTLSFKNKKLVDFNSYLSIFDWSYSGDKLVIDGSKCVNANYQALSLLILYIWFLKSKGCYVKLFCKKQSTLGEMWYRLGGAGCYNVFEDSNENFRFIYDKPMFAIRNQSIDIPSALDKILDYTTKIDMDLISGHEGTLRYIVSELLYNTLEHGYNPNIPSLLLTSKSFHAK